MLYYHMAKNLKRYYRAWRLRQQGKTLREIGEIMGFSRERARVMINYINFTAKLRKSFGKGKNRTTVQH